MNSNQFRQAAQAAVEDVISYLENPSNSQVVPNVKFGYLRENIPQSAPQRGEEWAQIHEDYKALVQPQMTNWTSPNFAAFFPCGTSYSSILGEMYAASYGGSMFAWTASPAATELEYAVMNWVARALLLPESYLIDDAGDGGGIMMTSASESILTVMVAARDKALRMQTHERQGAAIAIRDTEQVQNEAKNMEDVSSGLGKRECYTNEESTDHLVVLGSDTVHSSTKKAARILGLKYRTVPAPRDAGFAMTGQALSKAIDECFSDGLQPIFVTATIGTTSTCAIDDMFGIARVLMAHPMIWGHVDAAYAGAAMICPEYQHLAEHTSAFDSFNVNLHKWLLINTDASCLFVQSRNDLARSLNLTPSYLENDAQQKNKFHEPHHLSLTLTRRFRSLKVWFTLRAFGIEALISRVRSGISLGEQFAAMLALRPDLFDIITGPAFALTTFRVWPHPKDNEEDQQDPLVFDECCNNATRDVCRDVNKSGQTLLTGCEIGNLFVIRTVVSNMRNDLTSVKEIFEMLVDAAENVRKS